MEVKKTEIEEIVDPKGNSPMPRPISARKCECGCGYIFYPKRNDNIYINKQHADYAYNHGKRKTRNRNRVRDEKILLKNDNVLHKHFKSEYGETEIERFYEVLKADGFKSGYQIGRLNYKEKEYQITYRYMYRIFNRNEVLKIIIIKR